MQNFQKAQLVLEDGTVFEGVSFGAPVSKAGEVVFNTGMTGYTETLTDPSYRGQILTLTYPLVGNYGIPDDSLENNLLKNFESNEIQVRGLIVADYSQEHNHWNSTKSLSEWLIEQNVPAITGIDTRALTKKLREKGVMLGKIIIDEKDVALEDPNKRNLVAEVSVKEKTIYKGGNEKATAVVVVDCGAKNNIIRSFLNRGVTVIRVPWNYDFTKEEYDGLFISNGPGDPKQCVATIKHLQTALAGEKPVFGICLGNQLLALAAGADTYKLKYGHRSQNQPCVESGTKKCVITSQNHGYAVDEATLPKEWESLYRNANDNTNEGLVHKTKPFFSVQFHPEANPGPTDSEFLFDKFIEMMKKKK